VDARFRGHDERKIVASRVRNERLARESRR